MTQLLPHVSQASLGETCASYLDYITASLPSSLHSLHHKFVLPLISDPAFSSSYLPSWASQYTDDYNKAPAFLTLIVCAIALVVMSWRNLWRRPSPPYQSANNERPYTYLTPNDIVDPPARTYDANSYARRQDDDSEPDTLLLKHRKVTYELHFPPYSLSEGRLSVGQLRQSAAEVTHTTDPNRIKLLYKGKLLDDDVLPCRLEGLKQNSEILCVVSEVQPGARTPSDNSEADRTSEEAPRPPTVNIPEAAPKSKSKRKKKSKGKKKKSAADSDEDDELAPPPQPPRPTSSSGGRSALPPPAPNLNSFPNPLAQVNGLTAYFQRELLPLCEQYINDPPRDEKSRTFEHKKLGEMILAQVMIKADGIEINSDDTRNARRALIKEAQNTLNRLDAVATD
ncbi:hypothetical protein BJY04DRAFT_203926 [Aspergillus karnatakaensis]|uniref:uncharacterized protein n=1 Tax=Aspergillus karnatakaensis TaxID=1810916 RepID=UPI003CCD800F